MIRSKFLNLFVKFSFGGLISAGISFFSTPLITAIILPSEFGKASMFVLAFNFILQLILLGSDQSFVRFFYQDKFKSNTSLLLYSCIFGPIVATLASIVVILSFWRYISEALIGFESFKIVILLILTLIAAVVERFSTLLIRMSQKATLFSNLKIVQSLINAGFVLLYAQFIDKSFIAIVYGSLSSIFIVALVGIYFERKFWFKKINLTKNSTLEVLRYGFPFIPTFIISWVFEGMDKMALRYYSSFTEIGLYTAGVKIVAILTVLQVTFSNFWVPIAYEAYEGNSEKSKRLFENAYIGLSALFFVAAVGIIASKDIIIRLFANDYMDATRIMPFLVFMPIMYTLSEITVGGINFKKKTYWHLIISFICMLLNGLSVFLLVPTLGAKGAAISTGIAYIAFFYFRTIISSYYFKLNFKLFTTSIAIVVLLAVAFVNTLCDNKLLCYLIDFSGMVVIMLLYSKPLMLMYNTYRLNKNENHHNNII